MKSFNTFYENYYQLTKYVKENKIDSYKNILVQVFTGRTEWDFVNIFINEIKSILPHAEIVGATTGGEILDCEIYSNKVVVSFSVFDKTKIRTALLDKAEDDFALGKNLAQMLVGEKTRLLILFGNALTSNGSDILAGVESVGKHFKVAGGNAGNNGYFNNTLVFSKHGVAENGIVGCVLDSDVLSVFNDYSLCWQGIGKLMTVTKAIKNRVYEIDHTNIMEVYRKYLGEKVVNALPESATEFPLIEIKDGMKIARCPLFIHPDGSLGFIGNIDQGARVLFSYGDIEVLVKRSNQLLDLVSKRKLESIFVYSCTARRVFMQERIQDELLPLKNFASVCGFFTYGEYYQTPRRNNVLLNITTTLLGLSESEKVDFSEDALDERGINLHREEFERPFPTDNFVNEKREIIIEVLNNLINAVVKELEQSNSDLEKKNLELSQVNIDLKNYAKALKENQETLIEIEKAASLGTLVAGIAHNLKTPIMTSSGGLAILKDSFEELMPLINKLKDKEEAKIIFDKMKKWVEELKINLVYMSDIIDAVKGQAVSAQAVSVAEFGVDQLLEKVGILMKHELKKNNCELKIEANFKRQIKIKGNVNDLVQVLNVFISNAIDAYGVDGGEIVLKINEDYDNLKIEVRDQGAGINQDVSDKIFKEMVTTKGSRGRGLGLYIASSIIKGRFQGKISFASLPDVGTNFRIFLPIKFNQRAD